MPPREWQHRVEDILEAIARIHAWLEEVDLETFRNDERTAQAVAFNLIVIGEAVSAIPDGVQERCPDIPWSKMRGMRNVIAHEYFDVDPAIVWQTCRGNLLPLVPLLEQLLGDGGSED